MLLEFGLLQLEKNACRTAPCHFQYTPLYHHWRLGQGLNASPLVLLQKLFELVDGLLLSHRVHSVVISSQVELLLVVVQTGGSLLRKKLSAVLKGKEHKNKRECERNPVNDEIETGTITWKVHEIELPQRKSYQRTLQNESQHIVHRTRVKVRFVESVE